MQENKVNSISRIWQAGLALALCLAVAATAAAEAKAQHGQHGSHGKAPELGTSAAIDQQGRLWAVSKEVADGKQFVVLQSSTDMGKNWSPSKRVQQAAEPVAANGEERPQIAFGAKGEIYIAYTKPVAKPHIGDIRFVRSLDGGQTFSEPATVHANRETIVHSLGSMIVDRAGRIYIAWIDDRDARQAKAKGEKYTGSAIYYAVSSDGGASFSGDYKLAEHTCECCRISLALNQQGNPVALWRNIFAPNIRDHALAELSADGKPAPLARASFDDWRVDACPHHGPALAYAADGSRHQVWFSGKDDGGVFYAAATPDGKLETPVSLGSAQASHADVAVQGQQVAVVWKQFDGKSTAVLARLSNDGGRSWRQAELARTAADSDHPRLITGSSGIVLVWRTQAEGIRAIAIGKEPA